MKSIFVNSVSRLLKESFQILRKAKSSFILLPGDKFHIKVLEMATIEMQTNCKDKVDKCGSSVFLLFSP